MPHDRQVFDAPNGYTLRLVRISDEVLEMEATYAGEGAMPPEHLHPHQTERFAVLEGAVRARIGGQELSYSAGESFEVPPGTPHQMTADGPARMRWEVRPALRTADFFETLYTGAADENFLTEFAAEFRLT